MHPTNDKLSPFSKSQMICDNVSFFKFSFDRTLMVDFSVVEIKESSCLDGYVKKLCVLKSINS